MASNDQAKQEEDDGAEVSQPAEICSKTAAKESEKKEFDIKWLEGTAAAQEMSKSSASKKHSGKYSDPAYKKISRINGKINEMSMDELTNSLKELQMDTNGKKEVLSKRLKAYHKQKNLSNKQPKDLKPIQLDYVCVIDYEATCSLEKQNYPHEIIEFPVVLVNMKTLKIEDHFAAYCRPVINPKLTQFCTELTGITQEDVDKGKLFPEVLKEVEDWMIAHELGSKYKFLVATDGPWDIQNFLNQQCAHNEIFFPHWARRWIDVRKTFSNYFGVRRCNIETMLDYLGLTFEGKQHCGLHDSMNIATILIKMVEGGCQLQINGRIKNCTRPIGKNILKYGREGASKASSNADQDDGESSDDQGAENEPEAGEDETSKE